MTEEGSSTVSATRPGYNKSLRIATRSLLLLSAVGLIAEGYSFVAVLFSMVALLLLKQGTLWSTKNLKWMILSLTTCIVGMWSAICSENAERLGVHRAYRMTAIMGMSGRTIEMSWGTILLLFVVSAIMTNNKESIDQAQVQLEQRIVPALLAPTKKKTQEEPSPTQPSAPSSAPPPSEPPSNWPAPIPSAPVEERPPPMNPTYKAKVL